jgi:predicted secreted protein
MTNSGGGEIHQGKAFSITLSTSPTVSPEYRYSWGDARITGAAVRFERYGESEGSKMPGSRGEIIYIFRAVQPGEADILIPREAGPKAEKADDYKIHIRVR